MKVINKMKWQRNLDTKNRFIFLVERLIKQGKILDRKVRNETSSWQCSLIYCSNNLYSIVEQYGLA